MSERPYKSPFHTTVVDTQQLIADVVNTIDNGSDDDLALADAVVKVIRLHLQLPDETGPREDD